MPIHGPRDGDSRITSKSLRSKTHRPLNLYHRHLAKLFLFRLVGDSTTISKSLRPRGTPRPLNLHNMLSLRNMLNLHNLRNHFLRHSLSLFLHRPASPSHLRLVGPTLRMLISLRSLTRMPPNRRLTQGQNPGNTTFGQVQPACNQTTPAYMLECLLKRRNRATHSLKATSPKVITLTPSKSEPKRPGQSRQKVSRL